MNAGKLVRENLVLVVGAALPLLLVLFFVVAREWPGQGVADPQHGLLFASPYYDHRNNRLEFSVEKAQLRVRYFPPSENIRPNAVGSVPELYYFDPNQGAVREIPIELPVDDQGQLSDRIQYLDVPTLEGVRIAPGAVAPDGYRFVAHHSRDGGLITDILVGGTRQRHVLEKEGRRVEVPMASYHYRTRAIGWVIAGSPGE